MSWKTVANIGLLGLVAYGIICTAAMSMIFYKLAFNVTGHVDFNDGVRLMLFAFGYPFALKLLADRA